jgi:hypothetical protein
MNDREIRSRCRRLVDGLDIPVPFDAREVCRRVGTDRDRPIHLSALPMPPGVPCGLWVSTEAADFIFYEEQTSGLHQEHIILHELGHLLCDHEPTTGPAPDISRVLLPNLDPALVSRVLTRSHYSATAEREAEMIASLILERANRWQFEPDRAGPHDDAGLGRRLRHSFEPRA